MFQQLRSYFCHSDFQARENESKSATGVKAAGGQDIALEAPRQPVGETPPSPRSQHCDVDEDEQQRLQAALEAEQYDYRCLQKEISNTNNKLERLLKEKAQHEIEINNLKARMSSRGKNAEAATDLLEYITLDVQDEFNEVADERDSKMEEVQKDLDASVYLNEAQNARVLKRIKDLETEHTQTLLDLVIEMQYHVNRLRNCAPKECHVMTQCAVHGEDRPDKGSVSTIKTGLENEDHQHDRGSNDNIIKPSSSRV